MNPDAAIEILAKAARQRLDLLEDGETSLAYCGEVDDIRAALGWASERDAGPERLANQHLIDDWKQAWKDEVARAERAEAELAKIMATL